METKEVDEALMHTVVFKEVVPFGDKLLKAYILHSYFQHHVSVEFPNTHDKQTVFAYAEHDMINILTPFKEEFDKEHKHSDGIIIMHASSKNGGVKIGAQLVLFREDEGWNQSKFLDYWTFEVACRSADALNQPSIIHKGIIYEPRIGILAKEIELREQTQSRQEFIFQFPKLPECLRKAETLNRRIKETL